MSRFEFSAVAPQSVMRRGLRRLNPSHSGSKVVLWSVVAVATVYTTGNPGQFTITTAVDGGETRARFIQVQGAVENPSISAVQLQVNGATQPVSVAGGRFLALVPLTRGENIIRASVAGSAANLVPGSNTLRVNARIAPTDIWSALTWDGTADIDLHLVLPDGQDC
jgi:uncharacterized protein YfaP (DUF2135 family)